MKQFLFVVAALFFITTTSFSQVSDEVQISKILSDQQAAWNKGDIDGFMQGYWENDSLMFIGKSGITYGWQQTLNNYKKNYPDTAAMGKLEFEFVETKRLSAIYYFVVGKWHLTRSMGDIGGSFTLLFRKIKGKWVIVKDHSS